MTDLEKELEHLSIDEAFCLYTRRLQLWRLCRKAACHRARACRGHPKSCCTWLADWAEAVREAAVQEFKTRDPQWQADLADLKRRLEALSRSTIGEV